MLFALGVTLEFEKSVHEVEVMLPSDRLCGHFLRRARLPAVFPVQGFPKDQLRIIVEAPIVRLGEDEPLFSFVLHQLDQLLTNIPPRGSAAGYQEGSIFSFSVNRSSGSSSRGASSGVLCSSVNA